MLISGDREELASAALARVDALHTALTQIVLEGGNLDGIAAEVGRVLGVGVAFTSTDGRERAGAHADGPPGRCSSTHDLVDPTGRLRVERISGGSVHAWARGWPRPGRPGPAGLRAPDRPIPDDDVHALERAAAVAALLITREEAVTAVENKYQGDFLRDLLLRRAGRPGVRRRARRDLRLGPRPADGRGGAPRSTRAEDAGVERAAPAVAGAVLRGLAPGRRDRSRPASPTVDFSSEVVTLLPLGDGDLEPVAGHDVVRRAVTAVAGDKGGGRRPFSVGVSRVASGIEELPGPTPRPAAPSRSAGGSAAAGRRRSSTSSACTG